MKYWSLVALFLGLLSQAYAQETTWHEVQKFTVPDRHPEDFLGESVAVSGDYAFVGSPGYDIPLSEFVEVPEAGAVYIFKKDEGGGWSQTQKITASAGSFGGPAFFGASVSISGDYAIVGAVGEMPGEGAAYIFERNENGIWKEVRKFNAFNSATSQKFGKSVAISGDYAFVGDPEFYKSGNAIGEIEVFQRVGGVWKFRQVVSPQIDFDAENIKFGTSISFNGDYGFVGAVGAFSGTGTVYVLRKDGSGFWSIAQQMTPPDADYGNQVGASVSVSGNYAVVGTEYGFQAYLFELQSDGKWKKLQQLKPSNSSLWIGRSVSISGNYAVVGATGESGNDSGGETLRDAGALYFFGRDDNGLWNEVGRIVPHDPSAGDLFGSAVALEGNSAFAGVRADDHNAIGRDSLKDAGSVYILELSSTTGGIPSTPEIPLSFYPNPCGAELHIDLGQFHSAVHVTVRNIVGQVVSASSYTATDNIHISIDAPPGVYLAEIRTAENKSTTIKVFRE